MMLQKPLSLKMLDTLMEGKKRLDNEAQKRIVSFVNSQTTENGCFIDKSGKADLYYTSFGLMLMHILKMNINTEITEQWLDKQENQMLDLVNRSAYIRSRILCRLQKSGKFSFAVKQLFKTKPTLPAFSDYPHGDMYSPYSQFMLLSLCEDMGIETPNHRKILDSFSEYRVESGGYGNVRKSKHAATNATVAALAVIGQLSGFRVNDDVRFLFSSQDAGGGFFAGASSPVPDLLSTATALFMLKCYGVKPRFNADDFIDAHWLQSGGFCATLMDETGDVEYTFYGLLALGST